MVKHKIKSSTLIETLVALVILSIAFQAFFLISLSMLNSQEKTQEQLTRFSLMSHRDQINTSNIETLASELNQSYTIEDYTNSNLVLLRLNHQIPALGEVLLIPNK